MPQSSLRQSSCRRLLAIHSFDVGHLYGKFGSLFNRRKVKWPKNPLDFAFATLEVFCSRFCCFFPNSFYCTVYVSPHFYQFRWKTKRSFLLHSSEKTLFLDVQIKCNNVPRGVKNKDNIFSERVSEANE